MSKPHIIYLLSDQHNPNIAGFAGDPYVRTPNLDKLSKRSVVLDQCYCASPLCVPSRSSLLSGLLPSHNHVYNNMQCLSSDKATLPTVLSVQGYDTILCGRMHFLGPDQRHGYDQRYVGDMTPSYIGVDNEEEIYGEFKRSSGQNTTSIQKSGAGMSAVLKFDDEVCEKACDILRQHNSQTPLFLTVGFYGPHCPYIVEEELFDYYYDLLPELPPMTEKEREEIHPAIQDWYKHRDMNQVSQEEVRRVRAAYYGMVERTDRLLGKILDCIEETLPLENTIIVYTSDHGDNIGERGLFWKTNFYEGAARVPALFSWKGQFQEDTHITWPTSLLDLAPTLLESCHCPPLPRYDGISLRESLSTGKGAQEERMVFAECSDIKGDNPSAMIRYREYKLIYYAGYERGSLFHLTQDPEEKQDLAEDPAYQEMYQILESELLSRWNPEKAIQLLAESKAHFSLMQAWIAKTKPEPLEEWRGNPKEDNYLRAEKSG